MFVGVGLPASASSAVDAAIGPWRERFPDARWVSPRDRHVTLRFLGPVSSGLDGWVRDRVREAAASVRPFEVRLSGMGTFPSGRRVRVLWVGLDGEPGRLGVVADALETALAPRLAPRDRPFTPHVTVARSDPPFPFPHPSLTSSSIGDPFPVGEITLYRSHSGPSGRYEALERFPLQRPRDGASRA